MKSSLLGDWVIELYKQLIQVVLEAVWYLGARLASLCVINQYRELKVVNFPPCLSRWLMAWPPEIMPKRHADE